MRRPALEYMMNGVMVHTCVGAAVEARRFDLAEAQIAYQAAQEHPKQYLLLGAVRVVFDNALAVAVNIAHDPCKFRLGDRGYNSASYIK